MNRACVLRVVGIGLLCTLGWMPSEPLRAETAEGVVRERVDTAEGQVLRPLPDVALSNGRDVVVTDAQGRYAIDLDDGEILFVVRPSGFVQVAAEGAQEDFYYAHFPHGSGPLRYGGVPATGPLPESIDFVFRRSGEGTRTEVVLVSDTQPANDRELDYVRDDVVTHLENTTPSTVRTVFNLGDIVHDDLGLYERYSDIIDRTRFTWRHVPGNHDMDLDAGDDARSLDTYARYFGPPNYSLNVGTAHFVILDDVLFEDGPERPSFRGAFTTAQLDWLEKDLALVPQDRLVVVLMHIPLRSATRPESPHDNVLDRQRFLEILATREHVVSFAGHSHTVEDHLFGPDDGFHRSEPLVQHVVTTACGSWWSGPQDERGIPAAVQRDGTPNGWTLVEFDGTDMRTAFCPAGGDFDDRFRIHVEGRQVFVNVFGGALATNVRLAVDDGPFVQLERHFRNDPFVEALEARAPETYKSWAGAVPSTHLWVAELPPAIPAGAHRLRVVVDSGPSPRAIPVLRPLRATLIEIDR